MNNNHRLALAVNSVVASMFHGTPLRAAKAIIAAPLGDSIKGGGGLAVGELTFFGHGSYTPAEVVNEFEEQTPENAEINADGSPIAPDEPTDLSVHTKDTLLGIAAERGVKVAKSWNKTKIIAALNGTAEPA